VNAGQGGASAQLVHQNAVELDLEEARGLESRPGIVDALESRMTCTLIEIDLSLGEEVEEMLQVKALLGPPRNGLRSSRTSSLGIVVHEPDDIGEPRAAIHEGV